MNRTIKAPALKEQRKAQANYAALVNNITSLRCKTATSILAGFATAGTPEERTDEALMLADALLLRVYGKAGQTEAVTLAAKIVESEQAPTPTPEDAGAQD